MDLVTKSLVFSYLDRIVSNPPQCVELIPGIFRLSKHINEGAVWSLGSGYPLLLLLLTALILPAVVFLAYHIEGSPLPLIALGFLLGGAAGNLYDRIFSWEYLAAIGMWKRGVRDFIDIGINEKWRWPVFNLADIWIVIGVFTFVIWSWIHPPLDKKEVQEKTTP